MKKTLRRIISLLLVLLLLAMAIPAGFIISGMQTDNVVIISSSRISEIVGFLYKNNISDANTLDWPPESPDNQYHLNK